MSTSSGNAESERTKPTPIDSVAGAILRIPNRDLQDWLLVFFFPAENYGRVTHLPSLAKAAKTLALAGLAGGFGTGACVLLAFVFATFLAGNQSSWLIGRLEGGAVGIAAALSIAIISVLVYPIIMVVTGFAASTAYFVLAKIMGGKGTFGEQTMSLAYFQAGAAIVMLPLMLLTAMPCPGILSIVAALAAGLYGACSLYLIIRVSHDLSRASAAAVTLAPPIVILLFLAIIYAFVTVIQAIAH
jgi:hypothetical protein